MIIFKLCCMIVSNYKLKIKLKNLIYINFVKLDSPNVFKNKSIKNQRRHSSKHNLD